MTTQKDEEVIAKLLKEHREALDGLEDKIPEILKIRDMLLDLIARDGTLLLCGNGGSAADCLHWASEWRVSSKKNRHPFRAEALMADVATLTAIGNDFGFEAIFSKQIEVIGRKGDVLIAISTSGNSENIIKAIEAAKKKGIVTIGFGGKDGGRMATIVDIPFIINASSGDRIQEMHGLTMHMLRELIERALGVQ